MTHGRIAIGLALLMTAARPYQGLAQSTDGDLACTRSTFSVRAAEPETGRYTVAATLCSRDPGNKKLLLITAHGATYNHRYWDWPQDPGRYSFVRNQDPGASVLNIDLVGSGDSSHPPSAAVTQEAQAFAVQQLVQTMRDQGFEKIVLVGHSSGSGTVTLAAATYHDVDGLIVTGFLHRFAPPPAGTSVPMSLYPATTDPAFVGRTLDAGYLTTRPGTRSNVGFYHLPAVDPHVIAYDDSHKDVVTAAHVGGFVAIVNDPSISRAVDVPVLSIQGNYDGGFCDSPECPQALDEPEAWSPAAQLELHVIPDTGHNIHLHAAAAPVEFTYVREWLRRRFG